MRNKSDGKNLWIYEIQKKLSCKTAVNRLSLISCTYQAYDIQLSAGKLPRGYLCIKKKLRIGQK